MAVVVMLNGDNEPLDIPMLDLMLVYAVFVCRGTVGGWVGQSRVIEER